MKQNESFPYLALLVVLLCAGMLVSLIHPSRTFSAAENRELQQRVMPWEASYWTIELSGRRFCLRQRSVPGAGRLDADAQRYLSCSA